MSSDSPTEIQGIEHRLFDPSLVATQRTVIQSREEIAPVLEEIRSQIPAEDLAGPGFAIFHFISSVEDGYDVEVGFPVSREIERDGIRTRTLPGLEVLSLLHREELSTVSQTYRDLYGHAYHRGLISDEFSREVYPAGGPADGVEVQFIVHRWVDLLGASARSVLGDEKADMLLQGSETLTPESSVDDRFRWALRMVEALDGMADESQKYDVLSRCAHVFPAEQIEKLRLAYAEARERGEDPFEAVDAVLDFMREDPGWGEHPTREGRILFAAKKPRDPAGYESASDDLTRRKAYCYCPVIRNHLDQGMPVTYCYCGAGWFRQQWEGAIGRPVQIQILRSVAKGDDCCEFAIHLPEDL